MSACKHMQFRADVAVARLEDSGRFNAEIKIECADCHLPFQFVGLPLGLDLGGACMSIDGQQARLAIVPVGSEPNPLDKALIRGFRISMPRSDH